MKSLLLFPVFLWLCIAASAQTTTEAITASTIAANVPGYSGITTINTRSFSYTPSTPGTFPVPVDGDTTTEWSGVYEFADVVPVSIAMSDGNITNTSAGMVWTLRISVPTALNIGFNFSQFSLSDSAKMYIFDQSRSILRGVIRKNIFPSYTHLFMPGMGSNDIIIYVVESGNHGAMQSVLGINKLALGYDKITEINDQPVVSVTGGFSAFGGSINCISNVICYPEKMQTARAVARMAITRGARVGSCTGTLLNNENNNGKAYFLTAFHCIDADGNKSLDATEKGYLADASFDFRVWRPTCSGGNIPRAFSFTGATLVAERQQSDMVLLELSNPPGVGDGVTYAGWNRNSGSPTNDKSFIIHHPDAQDMRLTTTRLAGTYLFNSNFWQVFYRDGVVVPGSSGAALFNGNNEVVGQLFGGWSSCNFTDFSDRYGKLERSFPTIQTYLSPAQNLASVPALELNGLTIKGSNELGCTGTYSVPNLIGCSFVWSSSSNIVINSGQSTNSIAIKKVSPGTGWVKVVITDTKGVNRTLTIQKDLTILSNVVTGQIRQNGYASKGLNTENDLNAQYADIDFYYPGSISMTFTLTDGAAGYSWQSYAGGGQLNLSLATGGYAVFTTVSTSVCATETRYFGFYGVGATGSLLSVGPNPVSTTLTITADDKAAYILSKKKAVPPTAIHAMLYDFRTGSLVREVKSPAGSNTVNIDVKGLKPGQYIVNIEYGNDKISKHIIVE